MRLNNKEKIAGFPSLKIRDLLKNDMINKEVIKWDLKVDDKEAMLVISELVKLNYIEKIGDKDDDGYEITLEGNRLALAKAIPSINRNKADQLFTEFMQRVEIVNKDSYYLYKVSKVILFGSYLTGAATVNDIDLAVELRPAENDQNLRHQNEQNRIREANQKGRRFNNLVERYAYPRNEVLLFLKSKSRYISLHSADDGILLQTEVKQIFP